MSALFRDLCIPRNSYWVSILLTGDKVSVSKPTFEMSLDHIEDLIFEVFGLLIPLVQYIVAVRGQLVIILVAHWWLVQPRPRWLASKLLQSELGGIFKDFYCINPLIFLSSAQISCHRRTSPFEFLNLNFMSQKFEFDTKIKIRRLHLPFTNTISLYRTDNELKLIDSLMNGRCSLPGWKLENNKIDE